MARHGVPTIREIVYSGYGKTGSYAPPTYVPGPHWVFGQKLTMAGRGDDYL